MLTMLAVFMLLKLAPQIVSARHLLSAFTDLPVDPALSARWGREPRNWMPSHETTAYPRVDDVRTPEVCRQITSEMTRSGSVSDNRRRSTSSISGGVTAPLMEVLGFGNCSGDKMTSHNDGFAALHILQASHVTQIGQDEAGNDPLQIRYGLEFAKRFSSDRRHFTELKLLVHLDIQHSDVSSTWPVFCSSLPNEIRPQITLRLQDDSDDSAAHQQVAIDPCTVSSMPLSQRSLTVPVALSVTHLLSDMLLDAAGSASVGHVRTSFNVHISYPPTTTVSLTTRMKPSLVFVKSEGGRICPHGDGVPAAIPPTTLLPDSKDPGSFQRKCRHQCRRHTLPVNFFTPISPSFPDLLLHEMASNVDIGKCSGHCNTRHWDICNFTRYDVSGELRHLLKHLDEELFGHLPSLSCVVRVAKLVPVWLPYAVAPSQDSGGQEEYRDCGIAAIPQAVIPANSNDVCACI